MLELKKTLRYEIILDTLVLKTSVDGLYGVEIFDSEAG